MIVVSDVTQRRFEDYGENAQDSSYLFNSLVNEQNNPRKARDLFKNSNNAKYGQIIRETYPQQDFSKKEEDQINLAIKNSLADMNHNGQVFQSSNSPNASNLLLRQSNNLSRTEKLLGIKPAMAPTSEDKIRSLT